MGKQLKTHVSVTDEDGSVHTYGPGDDVPSEHAKLIENPDAWEEGDGEEETEDDRLEAARNSLAATQEFDKFEQEQEQTEKSGEQSKGKSSAAKPAQSSRPAQPPQAGQR
jgi:hypothetical protein